MLIESMPRVLSWSNPENELDQIYSAYILLLSDSLGQVVARISQKYPVLASELTGQMRAAPDDSFIRVLTAPESSYRLLWKPAGNSDATLRFLINAFRAEAARTGTCSKLGEEEEIWTAVGDMCFRRSGLVLSSPQIQGMMPLDFGSPYATKISSEGVDDEAQAPRDAFSKDEVELSLGRLERAYQGISLTSPAVSDFVTRFTKVLVLQKDSTNSESFSSGSSGQYICRSLIVNPHIPSVDEVEIADAIVHEAIHALLYMQEQKRKWVYDPDLYRPVLRVISPWTGTHLALRPFLQACFVWYGLLHFWCLAQYNDAFDHGKVRERIVRSCIGFFDKALIDHVRSYESAICPDLLGAIEQMQSSVVAAFGTILKSKMVAV